MSHYAQVKNGQVQQVIVAEADVIATFADAEDWIQTSYNTRRNTHLLGGTALRGNYAGTGYTYDSTNDVFYPPQPFASWQLNTTTWSWSAPQPHPADGGRWDWNEQQQQWVSAPTLG
jgi:hypothetical protein